MLLYVSYFAQPQQLQRVDQHIGNSRNSCLPTNQNTSSITRKITKGILHKTYTQKEDTFIKMALLETDFCFEVFKQLKNHVLSCLTTAT